MEHATLCIAMDKQVITRFGQVLRTAGYKPAEFARKFDFAASTVRSLSNGHRPMTIERALEYSGCLPGVTWAMLVPEELVEKLASELRSPELIKLGDRRSIDQIEVPVYNSKARVKGRFNIAEATKKDTWVFSRNYLADELHLPVRDLVVFEIIGDSMTPTLAAGDRVLVNTSDHDVSPPGIFMVLEDGKPVARRLDTVPGSKPLRIVRISDNPKHPSSEAMADQTEIIGRVVWYARRI